MVAGASQSRRGQCQAKPKPYLGPFCSTRVTGPLWRGWPALLLAGCSFAPAYVQPELPVPAQYPGAVPAGESVARVGWQDFFRDPELRRLIALALENNRDIRIAAARVQEARAAWRIEGASLYPQLNVAASGQFGRTEVDLPLARSVPLDVRLINVEVGAGWEIDFWGRLRNLRDAARWQYLASEEARRGVATQLVAQVANGYLLEREYEERAALAQSSIRTRQESLRIIRRRFEVGSGSKLDMTQAQTLLGQAQTALYALEQDQAVNRNALALLVGRPVTVASSNRRLAAISEDIQLPPGLPSELLVNRPDIIAAERQLRAANANIGAARAAFFPNIRLTGGVGVSNGELGIGSVELGDLFSDPVTIWSFAPTISVPIFNGGRLRSNLDVARARQVRSVVEYERTIQVAFRDVADALVRRQQLARQIDTTRQVLDALTERARLANLRFEYGRSTYLEVLEAQRDLFETEQLLVQLRRADLASAVALYAALGGGFTPPTVFDSDPRENRRAPEP